MMRMKRWLTLGLVVFLGGLVLVPVLAVWGGGEVEHASFLPLLELAPSPTVAPTGEGMLTPPPLPSMSPTPMVTPSPTVTPSVTMTPSVTPTPTVGPTGPGWLTYLNQFRAQAGLPAVVENETWSVGGVLHSRYMVKNDVITHAEDPGNVHFTAEGDAAGRNGNVAVYSNVNAPDSLALDLWMVGPFHAIGIIDPKLATVGFGSYREAVGQWQMGATLDVLRGRERLPPEVNFPLPYPKDGGEIWLLEYEGGEYPNPIVGCGYSEPSGPPLFLQLGTGEVTPNVTASSFSRGSTPLPHCVYDETSYLFPGDAGGQSLGRKVLGSRDAVVIVPQAPLAVGERYTVSITADGVTTTWQFTAVNSPLTDVRGYSVGESEIR